MKVIIVTQEDPFYIPVFMRTFLDRYKRTEKSIDIVGIIIQKSFGDKSFLSLVKRMLLFYGLKDFAKQSLKYSFIKTSGILFQCKIINIPLTIGSIAKSYGIRLLENQNVNSEETINLIKQNKIDLIVSVSASQIFKSKILKAPTLGCINLHNGPLPYYKGMMPNFWQMYFGEDYSVLTIHTMVEKIDEGDILLQQKTKIDPSMSFDDLAKLTKKRSADALWRLLSKYKAGTVKRIPLPKDEGSYFSFPSRDHIKDFKRKGMRLL